MEDDVESTALEVFPGDDAWEGIYSEGGNPSGKSRKCDGCGYVSSFRNDEPTHYRRIDTAESTQRERPLCSCAAVPFFPTTSVCSAMELLDCSVWDLDRISTMGVYRKDTCC
eukprot:jgi/Botrbrau1/15925/Bobra.40_1s0105.1